MLLISTLYFYDWFNAATILQILMHLLLRLLIEHQFTVVDTKKDVATD